METMILCEEKRDFNQNLIESPGSYEKLCDMMIQLEKDSGIEIVECKQIDTCVKYNIDLEAASRSYSEQVSD